MFCLSTNLSRSITSLLLQKSKIIFTQSFSSVKTFITQLNDQSITQFLKSTVGPNDKSISKEMLDSITTVNAFIGECEKTGAINKDVTDSINSVISNFNSLNTTKDDVSTVLNEIKNNAFLSTFLCASKRSVSYADYCAYYLLYPLMSSLTSIEGFEAIASYYMRMQNNKCIRTSPLAPPVLQLKPKKRSNQSSASQTSAVLTPEECLSKLDIRVGMITKAWNHPDSDKLICEEVDVGEPSVRSIGSGIRAFHKAEDITGKLVCVMCNMKGRKLAGYPSNGMLLCASTQDHAKGALIEPPQGAKVGERIVWEGIQGDIATPNQVHKKKMVETVLPVTETNNA